MYVFFKLSVVLLDVPILVNFDLVLLLHQDVLCKSHYNMFDLTEKRPTYWDPLGSPLHSVAERE